MTSASSPQSVGQAELPAEGAAAKAPLHCAAHPQVETNLRCGKCDKPICPKCLVYTPVGVRCRECAQLRRPPTYQISPAHYLKSFGVALGLGVGLGLAWGFLSFFPFFFYLNFLAAVGIGYLIGEAMGLAVNRKRGLGLQVIAGLGVFISFMIGLFPLFPGGGFLFPVAALLSPWNWLAVALGIYIAVIRLR